MEKSSSKISFDETLFEKNLNAFQLFAKSILLTEHNSLRKMVYSCDQVKLYHYLPLQKSQHQIPLLIVFATINRPNILDLSAENSFIRGLLKQGIDIYLLDWGYPDKDITFEQYVTKYLHTCISFICKNHHMNQINLLGICQGGVIALCYAAIKETIKNLILISTPVDFHTSDNIVSHIIQKLQINENENVKGYRLTQFFIALRPFEWLLNYTQFQNQMTDDKYFKKFLSIQKWLWDVPDQPRQAFHTFLNDFYRKNLLIKNQIELAGNQIKLDQLTLPIFNITARHDKIVPVSASRKLKYYMKSLDYTERSFNSGHIGIYISDKVGMRLPKAIADWIKKR